MKKLMVSISVVFLILTTGCEMRTMSKQPPENERSMSIVGTPVHEKDYKISDVQANNHEQSNY
ncbi:NF038215 family lipoprotein [Acinetobacter sp. 161(2023)]|uniref:NF038215 family lipoprotein n=1 Tax=Acinetobacter sp. 161(2023) TaxID=3098768 RepID=UPI003008E0ED